MSTATPDLSRDSGKFSASTEWVGAFHGHLRHVAILVAAPNRLVETWRIDDVEIGSELTSPPTGATREEFDDWARPHLPYLRRFATVAIVSREAEDVVQEALLRAWQRWPTYDAARGSARSWLIAITADRARRTRTRNRTWLELVDLVDPADIGAAGGARVAWPLSVDLRAAVASLSRRQRQAVVLHYYVGLRVDEVAALLGCAAGTVKSTLSDARKQLALKLGDGDD